MKTLLKEFKNKLFKLFQLALSFKSKIFYVVFLSLVLAVFETIGISMFFPIIESLSSENDKINSYLKEFLNINFTKKEIILFSGIIFFIVFLSKIFVSLYYIVYLDKFINNIRNFWREKIFEKFLFENKKFAKKKIGEMIDLTMYQTAGAAKLLKFLCIIISELIISLALFLFILFLSPLITLVITLTLIILFLPIQKIYKYFSVSLGRKITKISQNQGEMFTNIVIGSRVIKIYDIQDFFLKKIKNINELQVYTVVKNTFLINIPSQLMVFFFSILILSFSIYIYNFLNIETINWSEFISKLVVFYYVFQRLGGQFTKISSAYIGFWNNVAPLNLVLENINENHSIKKNKYHKAFNTFDEKCFKIEFRDLSFKYEEQDVFKKLNFSINQGDYVLIYGPSGAGKSTIVDILVGLNKVTKGMFTVNGFDVDNSNLKEWRSKISYLPQNPILFGKTIRENLNYAKYNFSQKEYIKAAKLSGAIKMINKFPKNIEQEVGEFGSSLSGGQKQLISLTQAMIREPQVLILDEPTTSLDVASRKLFYKSLTKINKSGITIILISHHKDEVKGYSKVISLEKKI